MDRRRYLQGFGSIALVGGVSLAGCSALNTKNTSGSKDDDTVAAAVGGKQLWMGHKREGEETGSTSVIHFWPDEAWIDERIEPRIDADNEDISPGTSLAELPISEIAAELDGIRTWVVFALDLSTPDEINDNEPVDEEDGYYWYAAPTAFFDYIDVESEHTFRVAAPDEYYDGSGPGRIIDILD
jgi:hypothetical protein